jgi:hypothetical protein
MSANPYAHLEGKQVKVRFMGVYGKWTDEQKVKYAETATGKLETLDLSNMIVVGADTIGIANILSVEEVA